MLCVNMLVQPILIQLKSLVEGPLVRLESVKIEKQDKSWPSKR